MQKKDMQSIESLSTQERAVTQCVLTFLFSAKQNPCCWRVRGKCLNLLMEFNSLAQNQHIILKHGGTKELPSLCKPCKLPRNNSKRFSSRGSRLGLRYCHVSGAFRYWKITNTTVEGVSKLGCEPSQQDCRKTTSALLLGKYTSLKFNTWIGRSTCI